MRQVLQFASVIVLSALVCVGWVRGHTQSLAAPVVAPAAIHAHIANATSVGSVGDKQFTFVNCFLSVVQVNGDGTFVHSGYVTRHYPNESGEIAFSLRPGRYRLMLCGQSGTRKVWEKTVAIASGERVDLGSLDSGSKR